MNIEACHRDASGPHSGRALFKAAALALCAILVGTLGANPAYAQDPGSQTQSLKAEISRLKSDIERAERDIRRTDSLSREEQAAATRKHERLARERERREKENAALQDRVRDARNRIAAEQARGDGYVNETGEQKARETAVLSLLSLVTDTLAARVDVGLPWDNETRRDRIVSLRRDIDGGSATTQEAFARLAALFNEETKNGDEVTLSSRPLTRKNGEVINAQALKIGNQAILYIDDDGKKYGILEPVAGDSLRWTWREDLTLSERMAVKHAVAVKAGRETPQLTVLDLPLAGLVVRPTKSGTAGSASDETSDATRTTTPATEGGR